MRPRILVLAAVLVGMLAQTGSAFVRTKQEPAFVTSGPAARHQRNATWLTTSLATHGLDHWRAVWDVDTNVPIRLWGSTAQISGTVANPAAAEAAAREFLAAHLSLLAPGASIGDFTLVSNVISGDLRSVGFEQRIGGVRVVGGAVGFAFKNDRMMMVSSSALPYVTVTAPARAFKPDAIGIAATGWLATAGHTTRVVSVGERVIMPIVRPRGAAGLDISYHLADEVEVSSIDVAGKWTVWVGADDGVAFARANRILHTTGTVLFNTPDQSPSGTRSDKPAPFDTHTVNGVATTSDANGVVTWNTAGSATVNPGLKGTFVNVLTSGTKATASLTLPAAGSVTWNLSNVEASDAQISSYVFANKAKSFAKATYNPTQALAFINGLLEVDVNVNDGGECNAFWDGAKLNFYPATAGSCENTGRMADVVYHEFGHGLHQNSVIAGIGQFDGGLSEGLADGNAMNITGDPGLGRGFFFDNTPLRDENPAVKKTWPVPGNEVHDEGEIIGETLWDLRTALQAKLGVTAGFAQHVKIYYNIMQRASDIPTTSYPEALAADDDDGDLTNGTPNMCEINAAFAAHNIVDESIEAGFVFAPTRTDNTVSIHVKAPTAGACTTPTVQTVKLAWRIRGSTAATIAMTQSGDDWTADIPKQVEGSVVEYQVTGVFDDGSSRSFPDNPADPFYTMYVGNVQPLWCADFEAGASDWTHTANPSANDEWEAGMPMGLGGDPKVAHGGTGVFGIDLTTDGTYEALTTTTATSPEIDLMGNKDVRLQFYRWLNVEDGFFDHATITVNGLKVWSNFASLSDPQTGGIEINHTDKEWRFIDLDLSAAAAAGKVTLAFGLQSDEGLDMGGWTMDDVCIVTPGPPTPVCGNGM
ncbi:MAG TPA: hypothetical protein VGO00_05170, partial [Kofleriaceae bacterium]|nr:hypothetical protein [Kofleriaceae bacterium]